MFLDQLGDGRQLPAKPGANFPIDQSKEPGLRDPLRRTWVSLSSRWGSTFQHHRSPDRSSPERWSNRLFLRQFLCEFLSLQPRSHTSVSAVVARANNFDLSSLHVYELETKDCIAVGLCNILISYPRANQEP